MCCLLTGQDTPNGIAWHNGSLLVMGTTRLTRYDNIDAAVLNGCNVRRLGRLPFIWRRAV